MKRQYFKTQMVLTGIVCVTLLAALAAVFFQAGLMRLPLKPPTSGITNVPPLAGHWLKTAQESWYAPADVGNNQKKVVVQDNIDIESVQRAKSENVPHYKSENVPQYKSDAVPRHGSDTALHYGSDTALQNQAVAVPEDNSEAVMPVYTLERAGTLLNRGLDSINVMYVWSDADLLKVISITSFNMDTRQAAIVVIPLDTVINAGVSSEVNAAARDKWIKIQDIYRERGRDGVKALLQEKLEIDIPNFVHVNQTALEKLSDIVGVLSVNGDEITMLEAFEQTMAGIRTDDRDVVQEVASRILRPQMLLEVPRLLWIFTHDIKTNFSTEQMIRIFNISRQMDLGNMRKTALPGLEWYDGGSKYVLASEQTWKNIMYEITN